MKLKSEYLQLALRVFLFNGFNDIPPGQGDDLALARRNGFNRLMMPAIYQEGVFGNGEDSKQGDEEKKTVKKRRALLKLIFLLAVPLLIMVALAAGFKEFYPVRKPLHLG